VIPAISDFKRGSTDCLHRVQLVASANGRAADGSRTVNSRYRKQIRPSPGRNRELARGGRDRYVILTSRGGRCPAS
jgi:hypothetical protein